MRIIHSLQFHPDEQATLNAIRTLVRSTPKPANGFDEELEDQHYLYVVVTNRYHAYTARQVRGAWAACVTLQAVVQGRHGESRELEAVRAALGVLREAMDLLPMPAVVTA